MSWDSYYLAVTLHLLLVTIVLSSQSYNYNNDYAKPGSKKDEGQCGCMIGPAGAPGVPGVPGMHGLRGQDGNKGGTGDPGMKGEQGQPGETGLQGPIGPMGHRGRRGINGEPGDKGDIGVEGDKGEMGFPGPVGPKGAKGDAARASEHVAFSVASRVKLGPVTQDTTVIFDSVITNIGKSFDEHSSHFICRVNGTYLFTTHILSQNNKDVYAWIMLNSKHRVPLHADGRAGYGTGSQTIILHLVYDDHVWLQLSKGSGLLNDYSTFSGYLLFEDEPHTVHDEKQTKFWFK